MDVHLRDLRYFVAVAEEESFTRAAGRLHVSQPALSKQIRQLELALRATLLDRDGRGVRLTEAGALLLPRARALLADWDGTAGAVAAASMRQRRTLRVGLQTSLGRDLYPAVSQRFAARQPGWRLVLRYGDWSDPTAGLAGEAVDAAFLWLPVPAGIEYRVLVREPRWVALPADHPLADRAEVDFADLADEPWVVLPAAAGPARDFWLAADARAGRPARIGAEVSTPDETFEAIASGHGVHLLAAGNAVIYARPGITCRPVRGLSPCELAVAWRSGDDRPAVGAFVAACAEAV
jgi:DNA-binding transcriptional LysR family regulator